MDGTGMSEASGRTPDAVREAAIEVAGEVMILRGDRTLYWPSRQWLILADLHVGKTESLRRDGVALPDGVLTSDLSRLTVAARESGAQRLLILGDLVHDAHGLTATVVDRVAAWRDDLALDVALVPGNHDRRVASLPASWRIRVLEPCVREGAVAFAHDADDPALDTAGGAFTWAGHVHPAIRLRGATDSLRLPCFVVGTARGIVPAFSTLTSGMTVAPSARDRAWVVVEGRVLELPHR